MEIELLGIYRSNKVIIDNDAQGGRLGVVPYLPLPEIQKRIQRRATEGTSQ